MKNNKKSRVGLSETIRVSEAAKLLGVNPMTLRRWDEQGVLKPAVRDGKRGDRRYTKNQILEILDKGIR